MLSGTGVAGSTVSVFDGTVLLGTTTANANGAWNFATTKLADGTHDFMATDSLAGNTSADSNTLVVTVDTHAPAAPQIISAAITGNAQEALSGTAEANSTVAIYDGSTELGTTTTNGNGAWSFASGTLAAGLQAFTATAMDAAGNISSASQVVHQNIGIPEPAAAISANYNDLVFDDEFNSYSTIDMSNSKAAGFNWYVGQWFSTGATNTNEITISNGVLELGGGGGTGVVTLDSAIANSSGGSTGSVFGNGAYIEASILYNPAGGTNASYWPAFWGLAIQHIAGAAQWPGQPSGYANFAEVDFMEAYSSTQYTGTIHDWSGTYSSNGWEFNIQNNGNNIISLGSVDWSVFHTYGLSWVPQAGNTPGHVTWYFDGQAESTIYWLGPATSTSLPGINTGSFTPSSPGQAAATYSVLDSEQLALSLQTDASWPMYVDWVRVWQEGSASTTTLAAPVITSFSPDSGIVGDGITNATVLTLTGTAEANSVVLVYDGTTWVGNATANGSGAWSFTTGTLANGAHSFTATDTDTAGDISAASAALVVTVDTVAPNAPVIASDTIINANEVNLAGTAEANSTVNVFDGTTELGTALVSASGAWTFTTGALADGTHAFTATDTDGAGNTSLASQAVDPTIAPPAAPMIASFSPDTGKVGDGITDAAVLTLTGTAEANSTVAVFDGTTQLGTATVNSSGAWSLTTGTLANGVHTFTATDTDAAGTSAASSILAVTVDTTPPTPAFASLVHNSNGTVTLSGTSEANSTVSIYDGTTDLGTATTAANGTWSFTTGKLSNAVQSFTLKAVDVAGNLGSGSNAALYGPASHETINVGPASDLVTVLGGNDTFVFGSNLGKDVITGFQATGSSHDVLQFSHNTFSNFASVLAHAAQVGSDVVITADAADVVTLKNVHITSLQSNDIHIV